MVETKTFKKNEIEFQYPKYLKDITLLVEKNMSDPITELIAALGKAPYTINMAKTTSPTGSFDYSLEKTKDIYANNRNAIVLDFSFIDINDEKAIDMTLQIQSGGLERAIFFRKQAIQYEILVLGGDDLNFVKNDVDMILSTLKIL